MCACGPPGSPRPQWGQQSPGELAAATHAGLVEDRLDVVVHGVFGEVQRTGDADAGRAVCRSPRCRTRTGPVGISDEKTSGRRDTSATPVLLPQPSQLGPVFATQPISSPTRVPISLLDPGPNRGLGQIEVTRDLTDRAVTTSTQIHDLCLELGRERATRPSLRAHDLHEEHPLWAEAPHLGCPSRRVNSSSTDVTLARSIHTNTRSTRWNSPTPWPSLGCGITDGAHPLWVMRELGRGPMFTRVAIVGGVRQCGPIITDGEAPPAAGGAHPR